MDVIQRWFKNPLGFLFGDTKTFFLRAYDEGHLCILEGTPGAGKTLFALKLAYEIAKEEGLALLLPFEQSLLSLKRQVKNFRKEFHHDAEEDPGPKVPPFIWVEDPDGTTSIKVPKKGAGGALIIHAVPSDLRKVKSCIA
jgi:hypothetical protein